MDPYHTPQPPKTSKTSAYIFKGLATVGFLVLLVLFIWGGIFVLRNMGAAFNSFTGTTSTWLSFNDEETTPGTTTGTVVTPGTTTGGVVLGDSTTTPPKPPTTPTTPTTPTKPPTLTPGVTTTQSETFGGGVVGPYSDPNGLPDLVPSVIATGYIDGNGSFVADSSPQLAHDRKIAVKFQVENKGTKFSNEWMMNVVIPTTPHHIFHTNTLRNLYPGEKIEFVISFTESKSGNVEIIINADPFAVDHNSWGRVKESNETNNILSHKFTVRSN